MLKNLLKTWAILAPDELKIPEAGEYTLGKTATWNIYPEIISIYDSFFEEPYTLNMLQGYIQRCIEDRGWSWGVTSDQGQEFFAKVEIEPINHIEFENYSFNSATQSLSTAYLTALAAQRPINPGKWQHF